MALSLLLTGLLSLQSASATTEQVSATPDAAQSEKTKTVIYVDADAPPKVLDKDHADYVRCKRYSVIGSRAKKRKVCMSNAEWKHVGIMGNEHARGVIEDHQPGHSTLGH